MAVYLRRLATSSHDPWEATRDTLGRVSVEVLRETK